MERLDRESWTSGQGAKNQGFLYPFVLDLDTWKDGAPDAYCCEKASSREFINPNPHTCPNSRLPWGMAMFQVPRSISPIVPVRTSPMARIPTVSHTPEREKKKNVSPTRFLRVSVRLLCQICNKISQHLEHLIITSQCQLAGAACRAVFEMRDTDPGSLAIRYDPAPDIASHLMHTCILLFYGSLIILLT